MTHANELTHRSKSLVGMLELAINGPLWEPQELAAILQHQLSAPLEFDLSVLGADSVSILAKGQPQGGPPIRTFRDLLLHARPPIELLELTRQFAKGCRTRPDGPLPDEIATLLYVLSIAVALTRCGRRITKLDDEALQHSFAWALAQPWVDAPSRQLIQEASQRSRSLPEPACRGEKADA